MKHMKCSVPSSVKEQKMIRAIAHEKIYWCNKVKVFLDLLIFVKSCLVSDLVSTG